MTGVRSEGLEYYLNGNKLKHATVQRDLGVLVHETQKPSLQVQQVIRKANGMLAYIARGIEYKSRDVLMHLYRALVRPQLEYSVQYWSPYLRKDILALEGVQKVHQVDTGDEGF